MSAYNPNIGGIVIGGHLRPSSIAFDTYPTHLSQFGRGGHHSYELKTQMDAIPPPRREAGMTCTITNDPTEGNNGTYELQSNNTWAKIQREFSSMASATGYVNNNPKATAGQIITVFETGKWNPYIINTDKTLTPLLGSGQATVWDVE